MNDDSNEYNAIILLLARLLIRAEKDAIAARSSLTSVSELIESVSARLLDTIVEQSDAPRHWRK